MRGEEWGKSIYQCVQQTVKFAGGSVMVWGCISCDGVGPIDKVEGRMNAKDYIQFLSRTVLTWMSSKNLQLMEVWPPQSPDLNPVEHVWDLLDDRLEEYKPKNLESMQIQAIDVQNLIASMPCQVAAVIAAKGQNIIHFVSVLEYFYHLKTSLCSSCDTFNKKLSKRFKLFSGTALYHKYNDHIE